MSGRETGPVECLLPLRMSFRRLVNECKAALFGGMAADDIQPSPDLQVHPLEFITRPNPAPMRGREEIKREGLVDVVEEPGDCLGVNLPVLADEFF